MRKTITLAGAKHPRDKKLDQAAQSINRAYMNLGADDKDIEPSSTGMQKRQRNMETCT
ncbi:hypothetical protein N9E81_00415 [Algibacter sp.]|nr:hypothetical protein [Algibacter sp.]